jgi:tRNA uridine 5-carbamoylmethylation protein Kti12
MKPKEQILKFIQEAYANALKTDPSESSARSEDDSSQNEIIQELFDGMSTGTARIIIEKEVSQAIEEKFNIDRVENKGRYYMAKIVRPDGKTIQRLLVDKQTGSVQMAGR